MNGAASGREEERGGAGDLWMKTVGAVSAPFLAGFSLTSVIVVTDGADHFRWPGWALFFLTIASTALFGSIQEYSRLGNARISEVLRPHIWYMYEVGIIKLLGGLGVALAPQHGLGIEDNLRWAAAGIAWLGGLNEAVRFLVAAWRRQQRSRDVGNL